MLRLEKGYWVDGRYKILRLLGKGSEGEVYLAFQEKTFRFYAVKEVKKEGRCFSQESVSLWRQLQHPGLPKIEDIYEDGETLLIVMEYIEGCNLQRWIEKDTAGRETDGVRWCLSLCRTLCYLHTQSPPIYHEDLKPDNIILRKNEPVLADMGSLIRQGSEGKVTGSVESSDESLPEDLRELELVGFTRLMESIAKKTKNRSLRRLARHCRQGANGQTVTLEECKKKLVRLAYRPWRQAALLLAAAGVLSMAVSTGKQEEQQIQSSSAAEQVRETVGRTLEDYQLDEQEDLQLRAMLKEETSEGRTILSLLQENPEEYAGAAYEMGTAYWYFYTGHQARRYGCEWFREVLALPEEVCKKGDIWEKSRIYTELESRVSMLETYARTGEGKEEFGIYWAEIEELAGLADATDTQGRTAAAEQDPDEGRTAEEDIQEKTREEIDMVRVMFWRETMDSLQHYPVELRSAGVSREQFEALIDRMEAEISRIPEEQESMTVWKKELQQDGILLREMLQRIYQEE